MTRQEVQILLEYLSRSFPNTRIEDKKKTVELWAVHFADYSPEAVMKAAQSYVGGSGRFFPSIAEIRQRADRFNTGVNLIRIEGRPKALTVDESGCPLCPYFEPGQVDFCDNCMFEGRFKG